MKPLFLVPFLLTATPLIAQTPAAESPAAPTAPATADPLDKTICKSAVATGSRLGRKRICMSRRDWALRAKEDQKAVQDRIAHSASQGF
jgi:hypothetical protein